MAAFQFHIAGLFFIAMNRILAPAFYAQGDTKSPTAAGIIGFAVNIALAFVMVSTLSGKEAGGGIALALSVASLANSVMLFVFLKRKGNLDFKSITLGTIAYSAKLIVLSAAASVPTYFLHSLAVEKFSGSSRIISFGIPLALSAICYGAIGVALLFATKDEILKILLGKIRRR